MNVLIFLWLSILSITYAYNDKHMASSDSAKVVSCKEILRYDSLNQDALTTLITVYGRSQQADIAWRYSQKLYNGYKTSESVQSRQIAYSYLGASLLNRHEYDSAERCFHKVIHWGDSLALVGEKSDNKSLAMAYNGLAVSCLNRGLDFDMAIAYFLKVLELVQYDSTVYGSGSIKYNIVLSYFFLENPAGLQYAEELYQEGLYKRDARIKCMGAYSCAMMWYLKKEYAKAEKYVKEAAGSEFNYIDITGIHNLYANILREQGKNGEAKQMYEKAISVSADKSVTLAYTYLSYGEFLVSSGQYTQAVRMLQHGVNISVDIGSKVNLFKFMELISICYEKMGKWELALSYYKSYKKYSDSTFSIERERVISDLQMKYEQTKYNAKVNEQRSRLEMKNGVIIFLCVTVIMVLALLLLTWSMYRYKSKMYKRIASQYKAAIRREKLVSGIAVENQKISKGKTDEIFAALEILMLKDRVFTDTTLTRDKLAERMNTNRTYLSNVVNERTGEPFNVYLNRYRINYALQLIEEKGVEYPMKAIMVESGFHSAATFYKAFKDIVGMTPAKYKEQLSGIK